MRFSVICTNYNKELYIEECIKSVLLQDFTDYEFIIIDDCSTDKSVQIIQHYANSYPSKINLIINEENIGMAAGYNKAMLIAKGDIISLIDSDDFWFQGKLSLVDKYFKEHDDCVLHQHQLKVFNFTEETDEIYRPYLITGNIKKYIEDTNEIPLFVTTTGLSFRIKELKKILPIPTEFSKNGEAFITRTIICYGDVGTTCTALGGYRKTDTNAVFGNDSWNSYDYIENLLKPKLNAFYVANNIDLYFSAFSNNKIKNKSIVKRIFSFCSKVLSAK